MDNIEIKVLRDPENLESILEYNPTTTIIIGGETDVYKGCGFYYSFDTSADTDSIIEEYTNKINTIGVAECYEIHQAMYHEEVLRADEEVCSANSVLHTLLDAIELCDYNEVARIIQFNLDMLKKNADKLQGVYSSLSKEDTWELKAINYKHQLKELTEKYNSLAEEVTSLRKYGDSIRDLELARIQIKEDADKISDLTAKLSEAELELSQACSKKDFDNMKEQLDYAEAELKKLQDTNRKHAEVTKEFSNPSNSVDYKDQIIMELKASITELTSKQQSTTNPNELLPLIDGDLGLRVTKLFNIKEIKRGVYVNALVEWIATRAKTRKVANAGYTTLIIIYDNLTDYSTDTYTRHGFCINRKPDLSVDTYPVVVTDILTKSFLLNTLDIAAYNYIVVVDRLGYNKMVVNRMDAVNYYLIDAPDDITVYNLKAKDCICYYDSGGECLYNIVPSETYNAADYNTRIINFTKDTGNEKGKIKDIFPL